MNSWLKLKKKQNRILQTLEEAAKILKQEFPSDQPPQPPKPKRCGSCGA